MLKLYFGFLAFIDGFAFAQHILPQNLSELQIYENIELKTLYPGFMNFSPQYPLWSDGSAKSRWVFVPAGSKIDTSNVDAWVFPLGTIFVKEFSHLNRRVETRIYLKIRPQSGADHWIQGAYQWLPDESDATLVDAFGVKDAAPTKFADISHDIPSQRECQLCHNKGGEPILGFDLLQLSDDIDPNAPNQFDNIVETPRISSFAELGLFTHLPPTNIRIHAGSDDARSAAGYLHGNCGHCHNPTGRARFTGFFMQFRLAGYGAFQNLDLVQTGLGVLTKGYQVEGRTWGIDSYRIEAGSPEFSAVFTRMRNRTERFEQMPPIATKVADKAALEVLEEWIESTLESAQKSPTIPCCSE